MRAGVIGHPIGHSKSPAIHGAWIRALGLDADYGATDVAPEDLKAFIDRHRGGGALRGVNVTIPHKEAALALADVVDPSARAAGAANVLVFRPDGQVAARNTDGLGMLEAFRVAAPAFEPRGATVVVLGAGGAARGAVAALAEAGAARIVVVNRTLDKAAALALLFPGVVTASETDDFQFPRDATAVINATSLGLGGSGSPRLSWPKAGGGARAALDMVYGAVPTGFITDAAAQGWRTVEGIEMLIGQAAPSFEAFFGVAPPEGYRQIALDALA